MSEIKWRYFKAIGTASGKSKKVGFRALTKPSVLEARDICKDYLDDVIKVEETTEDLVCYCAV